MKDGSWQRRRGGQKRRSYEYAGADHHHKVEDHNNNVPRVQPVGVIHSCKLLPDGALRSFNSYVRLEKLFSSKFQTTKATLMRISVNKRPNDPTLE